MKQTVLITGGAGYIGTHTAYLLQKKGYKVIVIDNLKHKQIFNHNWATFINSDFSNQETLNKIFKTYNIETIFHFAANHNPDSNPVELYEDNVIKTFNLLKIAMNFEIKKIIFASNSDVYGKPTTLPITEDHPKNPINIIGKTKLTIEMMLKDFNIYHNLNFIVLRYFKIAGSSQEEFLGEHTNNTSTIPLLIESIIKNKSFPIEGYDYITEDGTCIRDYLHITDVANANLLALEYLQKKNTSNYFNIGSGYGYSLKQIVETAEKIYSTKIKLLFTKKENGTHALISNSTKANKILEWQAKNSNLENIITSAYQFHKNIYNQKGIWVTK